MKEVNFLRDNTMKNITASIFIFVCIVSMLSISENIYSLSSEAKLKRQGINAAVKEYEPAVAVRASGCLTCHAEISSNYITDFGYESSYFFADPKGKNMAGVFNGHIYGDFMGYPGKTGWLTANFKKNIIVPHAPVDFDLSKSADESLINESAYRDALKAGSLADYLRALEREKSNPAQVIEKNRVFIGAPDIKTIETAFGIRPDENIDIKYIVNEPSSPAFKGIESDASGRYYTNTGEIICDGDLFIRGTLFLNKPVINSKTGCRIYVTGPVFLQKTISFKNSGNNDDKSNLQLVSAEAIFLGVGRETKDAGEKTDPMALRLLKTPARPSIFTRSICNNGITPERFTQDLYDMTALIPLEDSSFHDDTIGFSRLLLNAPIINSRYKGNFKGLVIAEFALFWQGKTGFEFDPIFKKVPVLPMLKDSDYLVVD